MRQDDHGTGARVLLQQAGDSQLERIELAASRTASGSLHRRVQVLPVVAEPLEENGVVDGERVQMVGLAFEVSNTGLDGRIHNGVFVGLVRDRLAIALEEVLVVKAACLEDEPQNLRVGLGGPARKEIQESGHEEAAEQAVQQVKDGRSHGDRDKEQLSLRAQDSEWPVEGSIDRVGAFRHKLCRSWFRLRTASSGN